MKKLFTLTFILFSFFAQADYWTQKANFGGAPRFGAVGFSIGDKGYVGTGANSYISTICYNDFWEYNSSANVWTQKANFGGIARNGASGFCINGKGYIGCGLTATGALLWDFWEYDPLTNSWSQKAYVGSMQRYFAVGFSIGSKGYIGTGSDNIAALFKDFWEYDPIMDAWTQKADFSGTGRGLATGFSDGIKGYIGTGADSTSGSNGKTDFWEYNPATNLWTQKNNFGGLARSEACAFWICPYGYIGFGTTNIGSGTVADFWKYNISNNTWSPAAIFGAGLREMGIAFTVANKAYVGTGLINDDSAKVDFWEYTPDSACATGIEELPTSNLEFTISPNPAKEFIVISYPLSEKENLAITITDVNGKKVYEKPLTPKGETAINIPLPELKEGVYFVELNNGKQKAVKKFILE